MLYIYKFFRYQHIKYIMKYKEQNNKILFLLSYVIVILVGSMYQKITNYNNAQSL